MVDGMPEAVQQSLAASIPFPSRLGKPEEFADLVAYILGNTLPQRRNHPPRRRHAPGAEVSRDASTRIRHDPNRHESLRHQERQRRRTQRRRLPGPRHRAQLAAGPRRQRARSASPCTASRARNKLDLSFAATTSCAKSNEPPPGDVLVQGRRGVRVPRRRGLHAVHARRRRDRRRRRLHRRRPRRAATCS